MDLLFKRAQTAGQWRPVVFELNGQIVLTAEEQLLVQKYRMNDAVLIEGLNAGLLRRTAWRTVGVFFLCAIIISNLISHTSFALTLSALAAFCFAFWYINENRETIFVKDLIHGRWFKCGSVVELAQKEAWLEHICATFRQVLEAAKHWDGTERHTIEALPREQAFALIRGEQKLAA